MSEAVQERSQKQPSKDENLHIFVNRRKFGTEQGVTQMMTGRAIATLIDVPPDNAVVRLDSGPEKRAIGLEEGVQLKNGMQFLVTRRTVEGGCGA
jgi:hypothetical protein